MANAIQRGWVKRVLVSRLRTTCIAIVGVLWMSLAVRPAAADDTALEAALQFQLGVEFYKTGNYRNALEHFLASNRLAPNRNVTYNIASCYEQLGQFPEAHSYYSRVLAVEQDPAARATLTAALERISNQVAVVIIESEPKGATVYVDRKELGARGETPQVLALSPKSYKILIEMPGHEQAERSLSDLSAGSRTPLHIKLTPITGTVQIRVKPDGATLRLDSPDGPVIGTSPADVSLAIGRRTLYVSKPGFDARDVQVDVEARRTHLLNLNLTPQRGSLVVQADIREAPIEVDGSVLGFTPSVLSIPAGKHVVRVALPGMRPFEATVDIKPAESTSLNVRIAHREEVTAASRTAESVEDAPASVTIISNRELKGMQYPTIAEAVRGVRGVYLTDDRSYTFIGVRGFSRTADYGNKVLVLQDGHPLNDNLLGQSYTGSEGRTDLGDVERIEVIRGPGSVMYGTGAFFGVVNLITRDRNAPTHGEAVVASDEHGRIRARGMAHLKLGDKGSIWASVAGARAAGRDFYFREYGDEAPHYGNARGRDGYRSGTLNGQLTYGDFTMQWFYSSRDKKLPTAVYETLFDDPRLKYRDTFGMVEARLEPRVHETLQLLSRAHVNMYNFLGSYSYAPAEGGLSGEKLKGRWGGLEQRFLWTPVPRLRLIAGGEAQKHFVADIYAWDSVEPITDVSEPYVVASGYGNADLSLSDAVRVSAGARYDYFSTYGGSAISPRGAIIIKPYTDGVLKLMGGRAFRAPSLYQLYYQNAVQKESLDLSPERVSSGEIEHTHLFSSNLSLITAGFVNYVTGLTLGLGGGTPADKFYFTNSGTPVVAYGGEFEIRRDWQNGWMASVNYSVQRSEYTNNTENLRKIPNSPTHMGAVRTGFPIIGKTLMATSRLSLESTRYDRNEAPSDPPQSKTNEAAIWDFVFSGEADNFNYSMGVYNAGDYRHLVPVSAEYRMRAMPQNGRTFQFSLGVQI